MKHLRKFESVDQDLEPIIRTIFADVLDHKRRKSGLIFSGVGSELSVWKNQCNIHIFKPKNRQPGLEDEILEHKKYIELLEDLSVGIKRLKDEIPSCVVKYSDNAANQDFIYITITYSETI